MKTAKQFRTEISEKISMYDRQIEILNGFISYNEDKLMKAIDENHIKGVSEYSKLVNRFHTEKSCFVGARNILQSLLD